MRFVSCVSAGLLVLSLLACFSPQNGDYDFQFDGDYSGECDEDMYSIEEFKAAIKVEDGEMTIAVLGRNSETVDCTLEDRAFTCELEDHSADESLGGVLRYQASLAGEWVSDEEIAATYAYDVTCSGDCESYDSSWFCSYDQDYAAKLDE